jgi:peptide/nickel transport system substrate-binding protein
MKNKYLLVLLIALISMLALSAFACSSSEKTTPAPAVTTSAPTTSAPTTSAPTTTAVKTTQAATTQAPASVTPKSGGTLRVLGVQTAGKNVGLPWETNTYSSGHIMWRFAEPLVFWKVDNTVEPWLATSWEFSSDYSSITFKLRQGVKFTDGSDFNADAVKYCYDQVIAAKSPAATKWKSIDVIDPYTVRINLTSYQNSLWADLNNYACFIVSAKQIQQKGEDFARDNPVGTGPFKQTKFVRDQSVVEEKNPNYWQPGKPYLDKIEYIYVKENMTQIAMMKAGEADMMGGQSGKVMSEMKAQGFQDFSWADGTDFLTFDTANANSQFKDLRVRQAFEYAIDKAAIVKALGYGYMKTNNQMPPPTHAYHDPSLPDREYNPDKAKQLLAEAGFPNGLKTKFIMFADFQNEALMVQQQLSKVGITVDLEIVENLKFWDYSRKGWSDSILFQGFAWGPNLASSFKTQMPPYSTINVSLKVPDNTKQLIDDALDAKDDAAIKQANLALNKAIYDDATMVFFLSDARGMVVAPNVRGVNYHVGADWAYWSPCDTWLDKK